MKKEVLQHANFFNIAIGFLFLSLFYPVIKLLGVETKSVTGFYRIFTLLLSMVTVLVSFETKLIKGKLFYVVLVFFSLFLVRILYDFCILKKTYKYSVWIYSGALLANGIFTFLSVYFTDFKKFNLRIIFAVLFYFFFAFGCINIIFSNNFLDFNTRNSGITFLWPTHFGEAGVSLAILSLAYQLFFKSKFARIVSFAGYIVAVLLVLLSGSKGPFFSLILITILYCILSKKYLHLLVGSVCVLFSYVYFIANSNGFQFITFYRILEIGSDISTIQRTELIRIALNHFFSSPLFGQSFLINNDELNSFSPHNILLHSLMSIGIIGGVLLVYILLKTSFYSLMLMKNPQTVFVFLFFIQFLFVSLSSASVHSAISFWFVTAIVINLKTNIFSNETINLSKL